MDALETLSDHGVDAEQIRAFSGPVTRRSGAVFFAREHDERSALMLILHAGVEDGNHFGISSFCFSVNKARHATLGAGNHEIAKPSIRKCSAHHDLMVAATRAV